MVGRNITKNIGFEEKVLQAQWSPVLQHRAMQMQHHYFVWLETEVTCLILGFVFFFSLLEGIRVFLLYK